MQSSTLSSTACQRTFSVNNRIKSKWHNRLDDRIEKIPMLIPLSMCDRTDGKVKDF